jgi:hypothetical protein
VVQGDVFAGPWYGTGNIAQYYPHPRLQSALEPLKREPPVRAEVRVERGAPRLFINGKEVFPLLAWSNDLIEFAPDFTDAGIDIFHPHYNLADGWREDGRHDWSGFVNLLSHLLGINPRAYFLVRLGLFAPEWWKAKHPQELIGYAIEARRSAGRVWRGAASVFCLAGVATRYRGGAASLTALCGAQSPAQSRYRLPDSQRYLRGMALLRGALPARYQPPDATRVRWCSGC